MVFSLVLSLVTSTRKMKNLLESDRQPVKSFSIHSCGALLSICTINSEAGRPIVLSYFSPKHSPAHSWAGTALISVNCVFMLLNSSSPGAKEDIRKIIEQ